MTYKPLVYTNCAKCGRPFLPTLADDDALCPDCWHPIAMARFDALCKLLDRQRAERAA